ncbi:MAG: formate dehydrogenase accessory sulfurtransferase FdhD [Alphaproteobacteria bacterium]|nr:MAG: formate dehydrogenase accessory sulfurtransferase FdhD [Alphaproteobacteria bacterium]
MTGTWQPDILVKGLQDGAPVDWHLAEEAPVALVYGDITYAVMLATPQELEDFAVGFSLAERLIDRVGDIRAIEVRERTQGIDLHISLDDRLLERLSVRETRAMTGRTGCGLCGIDSADRLFRPLKKVAATPVTPDAVAISAAVAALPALQPLKSLNRSVHGAAFVAPDGSIRMVREDVGRHNAIDKLIGALARAGEAVTDGFVLMTSRASYEIVEKAAFAGVTQLVTLSAPTAFAVRRAREANLALVNFGDGSLTRF